LITVASRITIAGGKIEEARLAVNAITAQPVRCEEAEKLLVGKKPDAELLAEAAKKAVAGLKVRKDYRATEEYRKEVCEVMIRRSLEESIAKAAK
jgi:CO/xanthine dehydrogenase FAD-binding subunit